MNMNITFLRHATAQDSELSVDDFDRVLTDKGFSQVKSVAKFCKTNYLYPNILLSSPYIRALQTAQKLSELLPHCPRPNIVDWLRLESDPQKTITAIKAYIGKTEDLWLVGHEPNFPLVIAKLIKAPHESIRIKKASLTRITLSLEDNAMLLWSIPCKMMNNTY